MSNLKYVFFVFLFFSCKDDYNKKDVEKMLNSNNTSQLVEAYYLIGEHKDTSFVKNIFSQIEDVRISHDLKFKGVSVYQSKMIALKKIYNVDPPNPLSKEVDKSLVDFYREIAANNGHLNDDNIPN
ncbi:hypothetical protein [Nonlabens xiamenensis]|uniref:hypothetical protein n=1 Tax=Nonlabens xiamenensis TaxID=2341043 RepID=UPI000F6046B1|nr:hypothetical protein [Nonlabens xiamenensis]